MPKTMKVLNNTRYHDADLQRIVDLFVDLNPKWGFRWGSESYYPRGSEFCLVFAESAFAERQYYTGNNESVRGLMGRSPWKSPHKFKMMVVDRLVANPVEALTIPADKDGYLPAPYGLSSQIYYELYTRFSSTYGGRQSPSVMDETLQREAKNRGISLQVRYRLGTRRRVSNAAREYEFQHASRLKLATIAYRSQQALNGLTKMSSEAAALLKITKKRTDGLPYDPAELRKLVDEINTNIVPAVLRYKG